MGRCLALCHSGMKDAPKINSSDSTSISKIARGGRKKQKVFGAKRHRP